MDNLIISCIQRLRDLEVPENLIKPILAWDKTRTCKHENIVIYDITNEYFNYPPNYKESSRRMFSGAVCADCRKNFTMNDVEIIVKLKDGVK
jgi:hypothetical protein